jgi:WD40 repeat protein
MARVFISHSSRDGAAARWIADWLLEQGYEAPFLDFDKHVGIPPGADWERTLYREIETCQALLILQSAHWMGSKWCFAEFIQARSLGKPIFQLLGADPDADQPSAEPLAPIAADLQQLDLHQDRQTGLAALARQLSELALDDQGGFPWDPQRPPYPGLLCFDQEDAALYFGRDAEIRELIARFQVLRIHGAQRLLVLLGASGAGKSSLLRAGLLPRLARSGRYWLPLPPLRPQSKPCQQLAHSLALALGRPADGRQLDLRLQQAQANGSLAPTLAELAADLRRAHHSPEAQILISVDQGEELFTVGDPDQVRCFFAILSAALTCGAGFQVVMTLRSDFLGNLQAAADLSVPLQPMSLPPLPMERIPEIIKGPAKVAGLTVEESLVQAAMHDASSDDALPLLAFALRELFDRFGNDRVLSLADYQSLGDDHLSLSPLDNAVRHAADAVLELYQPTPEALIALRDAFVPALVRINDQDDYTRRPARWDQLPPLAQPLLMGLVEARLLSVEQRDQERWVEVAHEALLRKWPLLRGWLDKARDYLVGSQQMETELVQWQQAPDPDKEIALLSGLKLSRAEAWLEERPQQFQADLQSFVLASMAHRDRAASQRRRQRQLVLAGLAALSTAATAAWGWAQWSNQRAYEAQTRQFQSIHLSMLDLDPLQSLVHGLAAMARLQDNPSEALPLAVSLDQAVEHNKLRGMVASNQDQVWSLAETPGGRLISGGRDGTLRFWNARGEAQEQAIRTSHINGVRGIVALNDHTWWTAGDEGRLQRWSHGQRQGLPVESGHGSLQTMVRNKDGSLITAGTDGSLRRWDATKATPLGPPLPSGQNEVWSVAVLPNGDWVSGGRNATLQWWRQGQRLGAPIASGQGAVTALEGLSDNTVISGGDDGSVRQWNQAGVLLANYRSGHSTVYALLRRHKGQLLTGGSETLAQQNHNLIRFWDPSPGEAQQPIPSGQLENLSLVELCNGDLISGGSDGSLHHWRHNRLLGRPIPTDHGRVYALTQTHDGDLVSGGDDGKVRIWRNGQVIVTFATQQQGVASLTTLADGSLMTGGKDGTMKHWSSQGRAMGEAAIQTRHGAVWAIAELPNGDLVSGGDDGNLRRWHQGHQLGRTIDTPHNTVVSLVVRKNGDWVSGGSGGKIQIWRQGRPLGNYFQSGFGSIWSLIERRDGELTSANGNGTVYIYPTPARAIAKACRQLGTFHSNQENGNPADAAASKLCANQPSASKSTIPSG